MNLQINQDARNSKCEGLHMRPSSSGICIGIGATGPSCGWGLNWGSSNTKTCSVCDRLLAMFANDSLCYMASLITYRLVPHQQINKPNMYYPNWRWPNQNNQFYTATTSFPLLRTSSILSRFDIIEPQLLLLMDVKLTRQIFQESPQELKNL